MKERLITHALLPSTQINDYWVEHYTSTHGLCTLCGNWGFLDTRLQAISPAGYPSGALQYCFCPNRQSLRENDIDLNPLYQKRLAHITGKL